MDCGGRQSFPKTRLETRFQMCPYLTIHVVVRLNSLRILSKKLEINLVLDEEEIDFSVEC